uniref:Uncharacterized protein n=1 Tax=Arundo donax TaxID=35708 RepID=A0A0A9GSP0_ARUDO
MSLYFFYFLVIHVIKC